MPAVELTRLREQVSRLIAIFDRPLEFRHDLADLCESYSDLSFRASQSGGGPPLVPSYRLSPLFMRQIEMELNTACRTFPEKSLAVADVLWSETHYEPRLFGALILGQTPLSQAEGILERLQKWANPGEDRQMLELLLSLGTARLRAEGPDVLLELYGEWVNSTDSSRRAIGLKALLTLAADQTYENLPPLFDLLVPLVRTAPQNLFNDLSGLLVVLAERTPTETIYFLRQILASPSGKDTPRLARRILPYLTEAQQETLKAAMKSQA
jgi:hypothetical protein